MVKYESLVYWLKQIYPRKEAGFKSQHDSLKWANLSRKASNGVINHEDAGSNPVAPAKWIVSLMAKSQTLNLSVIGSNPIQSTKKKEGILCINMNYMRLTLIWGIKKN